MMLMLARIGFALLAVIAARAAETPLNERVLVVYNSSAPDSLAVAKFYIEQRKIPAANMCKIAVSSPDFVTLDEYESRVKAPVRKCLEAAGRQKILYIVFSFRTPYTVTRNNAGFAVDQGIADIWDEYSQSRLGKDAGQHPYFGEAQSQGNVYLPFVSFAAYRETAKALTIYNVWRLDAPNAELARSLVYKAMFAEEHGLRGKACFDLQFGGVDTLSDYGAAAGDWDVHQAAILARRAGFEVVEDATRAEFGTAPAPLRCDGAVLYAGWYSLNHYNDAFTWYPGAIGIHLDSASAVNPRSGTNWAANALLKGITVTSGAVSEPYLEGLPHPDQMLLYLFQGANVGDALLRSTRWLKWMIINIGDPLYRPFPGGVKAPRPEPEPFLALIPPAVISGEPVSAVLGFTSRAPAGGTTVTLKSDRPDLVKLPANVTIPEANSGANVTVGTQPIAEDLMTVRITMSAGPSSRSNTLLLYPLLGSLAVGSQKVQSGTAVSATVTLNRPAPPGGITIALATSNPALAVLPEQVTVPAGANSATVSVATKAAAAETSITITASAGVRKRAATLLIVP
jgi:uncharacterized protein (TIGR03790 family)